MLLPKFELLQPSSLEEAVAALAEADGETAVVAGGTDILVQMKWKRRRPRRLVSIAAVEELHRLRWEERGLRMGALVTHSEVESDRRMWDDFTALAEACQLVGSYQVRNVGTVGGNLCNAAPSAESAPPLLVFDALVTTIGQGGSTTLPLSSFFVGPGETVLRSQQLLEDVFLPYPPRGTGSAYLKHSPRKAMDIATVGVAARVTLDESGEVCREARIALGAVAPTPVLVEAAAAAVRGRPPEQEHARSAARLAAGAAKPISDVRATAEYRREIVEVMTERALILAAQRAKRNLGLS